MLEIFLYNESTDSYDIFVDLFKDTEIELNIPLFPSSELSERLIDYTDSFDLPATQRNLSEFDKENTERFKCQMKSGGQTITGFLSVNSITYNTPESSINVNFVSIIKYVIDKMKETPFSNLFKDYNETGANPYDDGNGNYINDGEYGFTLDETVNDEFGSFMKLAVNNMVSEQYTEINFPVYLMDNKEGSRSAQPTFNLEKLLLAIFDYYDVNVSFSDFIMGARNYDEIDIKIPTNFKSESGKANLTNKIVYGYFSSEGLSDNYVAVHPDLTNFVSNKTITDENSNDYSYYTPQENIKRNVSGTGSKSGYEATLLFALGSVGRDIPPYAIGTTSGRISPAIGVYNYDTLIGYYEDKNENIFHNLSSIDLSEINFILSTLYGDAIRFELGFSANNFEVYTPASYDYSTGLFGEPVVRTQIDSGYYKYGDNQSTGYILVNHPTYPASYPIYIRMVFGNTEEGGVQLSPYNDYSEARYGDKVILEKSYEDTELKMYDIINKIIKRFNLSIKEKEDGELIFLRENDFYNSNIIVLDNKLNKEISKTYYRKKTRSISLKNNEYGNINDRIDFVDDDDKILIYDVDKFILNEAEFDEQEYSFDSSIQNQLVYGKKLLSDEIDSWDFLKLEHNTALWNANTNEKIKTSSLPITFGEIEQSGLISFRVPRSVYADERNYPNATDEGIESNYGVMVVEHTSFDCNNEFPILKEISGMNISDGKGSINESSVIYENFEGFFNRNKSDAINISVNAYLTNEEIMNIRNGYKIQLFGEIYKPINISNIQFEKDGSIVEIEMTKERGVTDATFDNTNITFDSDAYTWDSF